MAQIIFEEQWGDNFYTRLECNAPFVGEQPWAAVDNIVIVENINWMSPIVKVEFVDSLGVIPSAGYFSTESEYKLHLGQDAEDTMVIPISPLKMEVGQMQPGLMENFHVSFPFYMDHWHEMNLRNRCRGWRNRKYSDVVNVIAEECGFEEINIQPTRNKYSIIQPDMTNYQMLRWLQKESKSIEGDHAYQIGVSADGSFFYQSLNSLYNTEPTKTLFSTAKDFTATDGDENTFMLYNLNFKNKYLGPLTYGASGIESCHYNWETKEFVYEEHYFSDMNQDQLSEWSTLAEKDEMISKLSSGGRDIDRRDEDITKVIQKTNAIHSLSGTMMGNMDISIGEVVKVIISPSEKWDIDISETSSGYYMISRVQHNIMTQKRQFVTDVTLQRVGTDLKELEGLVESSSGKV